MRVLMVLEDWRVGGAEQVALDLVRATRSGGVRFIAAAVRRDGPLAEEFARAGAEVRSPLACCRFDPLAAARVGRLIRREDVDAVLVVNTLRNGMFYAFVGSALSRRRPVTLCWCHSHYPGDRPAARQLSLYRRMGLLDAILCVGRNQRNELLAAGLGRRGVGLLRNGVDLRRFSGVRPTDLPVSPERAKIVHVANVTPAKDFDTLLAAAGLLAERRRDFHLLLVGRGTDGEAMRSAVAARGLADRAILLGVRRDVPEILGSADILVQSSRRESFGLSVLEAMASGVPAVVSDIPALREATGGEAGVRVPPGDPGALAEALTRLLDDPARRAALAEAGRRRARAFSTDRMARSFTRLLRVLVGAKRAER